MNTIDSSNTRVGFSDLARATYIVFFQMLNAAIEAENAFWQPLDEKLAQIKGIDYSPLVIELIDDQNFYLGHVPSLIEAPVEKYPNVSVDVDRSVASEEDTLDQGSIFEVNLYIEFFVKSDKDEEEVSERAMRMLDSIHAVLMSNKTLAGVTNEIGETPRAQLTDVFVRPAETSYGEEWFWRGGRLEYPIKKIAMASGSSALTATRFDFDQN